MSRFLVVAGRTLEADVAFCVTALLFARLACALWYAWSC